MGSKMEENKPNSCGLVSGARHGPEHSRVEGRCRVCGCVILVEAWFIECRKCQKPSTRGRKYPKEPKVYPPKKAP